MVRGIACGPLLKPFLLQNDRQYSASMIGGFSYCIARSSFCCKKSKKGHAMDEPVEEESTTGQENTTTGKGNTSLIPNDSNLFLRV
jgi:hypothetical protein